MRYLVTGAHGFAGRHLVSELEKQGREVISLGHEDLDLLDFPATRETIADFQPDGIFHLAAPHTSVGKSWADPAKTMAENLGSTHSVMEAARLLDPQPRVLFVSSSEVFGKHGHGPLTEDARPAPLNPYGLSKLLGEQWCQFYQRIYGVPVVIARPFNHIGPGQKLDFVFPNFARQIAQIEERGEPDEIRVGNLAARRDFTDVRDVVRAYTILMDKGTPGEVYHIGTGRSRSIRDVLELLLDLSPALIKVVVDPKRMRPNDVPEQRGNYDKLRALGWGPTISLSQSLKDILTEARQRV